MGRGVAGDRTVSADNKTAQGYVEPKPDRGHWQIKNALWELTPMMSLRLAAIIFSLVAIMPASAGGLGGEAAELESARANARAGGPVSERDAELLQRYGCLSGTDNAYCRGSSVSKRISAQRRYDRRLDRDD